MLIYGAARRGFEYPMQKFVLITETDIFGKEKKKNRKKSRGTEAQKHQKRKNKSG